MGVEISGRVHKTGSENTLHFPYGLPEEIFSEVGLTEMFFNKETGLLRREGIPSAVTRDHVLALDAAIERHRQLHPGVTPQFTGDANEANHARLLRFRFWMWQAVMSCKKPVLLFV